MCGYETQNRLVTKIMVSLQSTMTMVANQHLNQSYFKNDIAFLQQTRQSFVAELIFLLANRDILTLSRDEKSLVLKTFIESLCDADAINMYPTGNLKHIETQ